MGNVAFELLGDDRTVKVTIVMQKDGCEDKRLSAGVELVDLVALVRELSNQVNR